MSLCRRIFCLSPTKHHSILSFVTQSVCTLLNSLLHFSVGRCPREIRQNARSKRIKDKKRIGDDYSRPQGK